jgi:hypothetical protein
MEHIQLRDRLADLEQEAKRIRRRLGRSVYPVLTIPSEITYEIFI